MASDGSKSSFCGPLIYKEAFWWTLQALDCVLWTSWRYRKKYITTFPKSFPSREYQVKYGKGWHGQAGSPRLSLRTGEHRNQLVVPGKLPNTEHKWGGDCGHERNREKASTDVEVELHLTKQSPWPSEFCISQTAIIFCHISSTPPYQEIIWVPQQEQNPGLSPSQHSS